MGYFICMNSLNKLRSIICIVKVILKSYKTIAFNINVDKRLNYRLSLTLKCCICISAIIVVLSEICFCETFKYAFFGIQFWQYFLLEGNLYSIAVSIPRSCCCL